MQASHAGAEFLHVLQLPAPLTVSAAYATPPKSVTQRSHLGTAQVYQTGLI